jgi:hypothetical protein
MRRFELLFSKACFTGWQLPLPRSAVRPRFWITSERGCFSLRETQKLSLKQFFGSLAIPIAASESAQPVQERCERSGFGTALLKRCSGSTRS